MALSIPSSDEKRGNFIGGAFVPPQSGQYEPCRNPADIRDVLGLYPRSAVGDARAAVDAACVRDRGAPFAALKEAEADAVLVDIADGRVTDERLSLTSWFNEIVYPLFVEACFADPMYGGNRSAVFWKMIGYPGLPANHAIDMVRYRGKPYPGAGSPKSIGDFS